MTKAEFLDVESGIGAAHASRRRIDTAIVFASPPPPVSVNRPLASATVFVTVLSSMDIGTISSSHALPSPILTLRSPTRNTEALAAGVPSWQRTLPEISRPCLSRTARSSTVVAPMAGALSKIGRGKYPAATIRRSGAGVPIGPVFETSFRIWRYASSLMIAIAPGDRRRIFAVNTAALNGEPLDRPTGFIIHDAARNQDRRRFSRRHFRRNRVGLTLVRRTAGEVWLDGCGRSVLLAC